MVPKSSTATGTQRWTSVRMAVIFERFTHTPYSFHDARPSPMGRNRADLGGSLLTRNDFVLSHPGLLAMRVCAPLIY
jgi:hypothetical protein